MTYSTLPNTYEIGKAIKFEEQCFIQYNTMNAAMHILY
jgi:hypothetical protein